MQGAIDMIKSRPNYINRELSWLEFNQRVLNEALDPSVPLLERLNFLSITASNLDEFFMVRVGGLESLVAEGVTRPDPAGMTPSQQLKAVCARVKTMAAAQYACYHDVLIPKLTDADIRQLNAGLLATEQRDYFRTVFKEEILPVATPMTVNPDEPFPYMAGLTLALAVRIAAENSKSRERFALIPFGRNMNRFIPCPSDSGYRYILLEDLTQMFVEDFFPGVRILETAAFRITRNADMSVNEDDAADFLAEMRQVLRARRQSKCVRLEIAGAASDRMTAFLGKSLDAPDHAIYRLPGPIDLSAFRTIASISGFERLKYESWQPQPTPELDIRKSMFAQVAEKSVVLFHPYDSYDPVVRLIEEAARDPNVLAIKQVLYRTGADSSIVAALRNAAERGKYVTAVVELKARFDEARNIEWARMLAQSGVQVIYGVKGLKVHAKVCVIVRREGKGIVRYVHFGTGNYNERTARLYSDVSYISCADDLGVDASAFFNAVCGYSEARKYRKIFSAPVGLREKVLDLIAGEAERKRQGQKAFIMAKVNSLTHPDVIAALYEASKAGVKIMLNVRGICSLRPGVPGLSDNINVVSIVDRFLEHSRILYFHHGGDEKVFISSADWMTRNLDRRIELLVPVDNPVCRKRLISDLETFFKDSVKSYWLLPDGRYERTRPAGRRRLLRSQELLWTRAKERAKSAHPAAGSVFEPYKAPDSAANR